MDDEASSHELEPQVGTIVDDGGGRHRGSVDEHAQVQQQLEVAYRFTGPIPHPHILEQYDRVVPGSAKQIVDAFTKEGSHRRSLERADSRRLSRGQGMGFFLAIFFFVVAGFLVLKEHDVVGTIFGTFDVVGLVTAFVWNRSEPAAESEESS